MISLPKKLSVNESILEKQDFIVNIDMYSNIVKNIYDTYKEFKEHLPKNDDLAFKKVFNLEKVECQSKELELKNKTPSSKKHKSTSLLLKKKSQVKQNSDSFINLKRKASSNFKIDRNVSRKFTTNNLKLKKNISPDLSNDKDELKTTKNDLIKLIKENELNNFGKTKQDDLLATKTKNNIVNSLFEKVKEENNEDEEALKMSSYFKNFLGMTLKKQTKNKKK